MKRINALVLVVAGLLAFSASAFAAPTATVFTTLTTAISATDTAVVVASTTGFAISTTSPNVPTYILIDQELMKITGIPVAGTLSVVRKQDRTASSAHASGVYVVYGIIAPTQWVHNGATGSLTYGNFLDVGTTPIGPCVRTSQQFSPMFVVPVPGISGGQAKSGVVDCVGGQWSYGDWPVKVNVTAIRQCTVPIGGDGAIIADLTAYGTDATRVSGTIYRGSIQINKTGVFTLLSNLTGTTAPTTDKQLFAIYDSAPGTTTATTIATTALAGAAAATADIFFDQNLTTPVILVPGRYFFALQMNGTTTTIQMIPTAGGRNSLVGGSSTGVFGTLGGITVNTTLTTSAAPIMCSDGVN